MASTSDVIQGFEGFSSRPYWDVNHWRIGYGSDTITTPGGAVVEVTPGMTTTRADAARDLDRRVSQTQQSVIATVGQAAWDNLSDGAKSAVTSLAYNYGGLSGLPSLTRAIQSGDNAQIASAIAARANDNGGVNSGRREAEAALVAGHPVPPGSVPTPGIPAPNGRDERNLPNASGGPDDRSLSGFVPPNVTPIPLAPLRNVPRLAPLSPAVGSNALTPAQRLAMLALPDAVPPLPIPRPAGGGFNGLDAAANAPSGAPSVAPAQTWTSPNGHTYTVGDTLKSGGGTYLVTPTGLEKQGYSPPGAGQPNVYDSVLGHVLGDAMNGGAAQIKQTGRNLVSGAENAAGDAWKWLTGSDKGIDLTATPSPSAPNIPAITANLGGMLGNLFGGGKPSSPAPAAPSVVPQTYGPVGQSASPSPPSVPQSNGPAGGYYSPPYVAPPVAPRVVPQTAGPAGQPAYTYKTEVVTNPDYTAWQKDNAGYQGYIPGGLPGNDVPQTYGPAGGYYSTPYADLVSKPASQPPPKTVTKSYKVPTVPVPQVAPVIPLSPPQDELAALREQAMNPLQRMFAGSPIGHILNLGANPSYGAPHQGGLLALLAGLGRNVSSPASISSQLTAAIAANQNPAALAAIKAGQPSYSTSGGGLMPTVAINGNIRNSYGDEQSHPATQGGLLSAIR
jgi:GH24 family phage-related lysozyme (muramidase)